MLLRKYSDLCCYDVPVHIYLLQDRTKAPVLIFYISLEIGFVMGRDQTLLFFDFKEFLLFLLAEPFKPGAGLIGLHALLQLCIKPYSR